MCVDQLSVQIGGQFNHAGVTLRSGLITDRAAVEAARSCLTGALIGSQPRSRLLVAALCSSAERSIYSVLASALVPPTIFLLYSGYDSFPPILLKSISN